MSGKEDNGNDDDACIEEEKRVSSKNMKLFIYNNKLFQFNFDTFAYHSTLRVQNKLKNSQIINVIDETDSIFKISEDSINDFIKYIENENVTITKSNSIDLHFLSIKY